jgi:adenylate cyclase
VSQTRRLAAILAADVAGYSRLMGEDEEGTLERLKALRRELLDPTIAEHHGRIVKTTGDGLAGGKSWLKSLTMDQARQIR